MATTYQEHTGNGSTTTFSYPFPVLKTEDIKVALNGVTQTTGYTATTSPSQVVFSSAPTSGVQVRVYRDTDVDLPKAFYAAGSSIRAADLNNNHDQVLYALQEEQNQKGIFEEIKLDDDVKIKLGNSDDFTIEWESSSSDALLTVAGDYTVDTTGEYKFKVGGSQKLLLNNGDFISYQTFKPNTDDSIDLGTSSAQWRNLYVDGTGYIDNISADAATINGNITVSGTVDGRDVAADGTKLDTIETNSKDDQTAAEIKILLQSNKLTDSEIATGTLDNRYYTETEADARFYNLASTEEIQSGETWVAADNKVATTAAIDARIIDLVDDVGGFVPIANETSFPNANPDVNNGAGTLISVPLANSLTSSSGGVISISNGTVGNSTVTITGAGNTKTYAQGFGIIVETTSTTNTYTFHRYVPKATEVTTVAGNISNITTVAGNNTNISTVAGIDGNVTTVAGIASNVTTVANDGADIGTVAGAISNVNNVGNSISNVNTTAGSIANVNTVSTAIANINTVAGISSNVTSVAGISANVTTVAANNSNINAVAGDAADIGACATNIGSIAAIGSDLANNFENITDYGSITGAVTSTSGTSDISTLASGSHLTNIATVSGISANVTTVAANTTAINNVNTNLTSVQGAVTSAANAASSAIAAASSATSSATSATTSSTSAAEALTYRDLALTYRNDASAFLTQVESLPYNLVDSVTSHTAWGNITDTGTAAVFTNESSTTKLTMAEGSSSYNYGSIT